MPTAAASLCFLHPGCWSLNQTLRDKTGSAAFTLTQVYRIFQTMSEIEKVSFRNRCKKNVALWEKKTTFVPGTQVATNDSIKVIHINKNNTLVFHMPPEVQCFRYVLGGPNTSSPCVWKHTDKSLYNVFFNTSRYICFLLTFGVNSQRQELGCKGLVDCANF